MKESKINTFKKYSYNTIDACKAFFYVILINITAIFFLYVISLILRAFPISMEAYSKIISLLQVFIIPSMFLTYIIIKHKNEKISITNALELKVKINPLIMLVILVMLIVTIVSAFPLINMLYDVLGSIGFNVDGSVAYEMDTWWRLLIGVIPYCILPAIVEEIIFRGIMQKGFLKKSKPSVAIFIVSMSFFIMHGGLQQSFYQIILGFMLGFIGYYGGNIIYPIVFHLLNNLAVVLLSYFGVSGFLSGFSFTLGGFMIAILIFIAGAGAIIGLIYLLRLITKKQLTNGENIEVQGDQIIVTNNALKLNFKETLSAFSMDERFYFKTSWIVAIMVWIIGTLS